MRIYFDASGINAINDDPAKAKVVDRLSSHHIPLISTLTLGELAATPVVDTRRRLCLVAHNLTKSFTPPYHRLLVEESEMMRRALEGVITPASEVDYCRQPDHFPELGYLSDRKSWDYPEPSDGFRGWGKRTAKKHKEMIKRERDVYLNVFEQLSPEDKKLATSRRANFLRLMMKDESLIHSWTMDELSEPKYGHVVMRVSGIENEIMTKSEVWRFHLASIAIEIYNRMIRAEKYSEKHNPGWVDIRQSVYLAAADVFVTNDKNQRNFMRLVARFSLTPKRIWSYERLRASLNIP